MALNRPLTWRIQSIPAGFTEERLKSCFHSDDKACIEIKSLVSDVSNYDGDGTLTATMLFSPQEPREPRFEEHNDFDIDIDKDFIGFTPLNNPAKDVCADIVAVTGLAGHAFGSWAHSAQRMWLRDYLPWDIQNRARILIYGYESQLHGANTATSIISDYGNSFTQGLMDLRDHPSCRDRPLILIGHSLGALIIKQAITDLEPNIRSRLPVRTLLFFGAPHNGLEVTALETLVKGCPTQTLISELKRESPTLTGLSERFRHVAKDLTIHTYYESRPTNTVAEGADGRWERRGEAKVMVERSSALLNFETEKTRMKVDGDHKEIARLRRGQGGIYPNVLRIIKEALTSASDQLAAAQATQVSWICEEGASAMELDLFSGLDVVQNSTENKWDYDHFNLICDRCYNEFLRTEWHLHCFICRNGNYNVCVSCNDEGTSCLGGHDMVWRQLRDFEKYDQDEDKGDFQCIGWCNLCGSRILNNGLSLHCSTCNNGGFNICLACRKSGHICVVGHKLSPNKVNTTTTSTINTTWGTKKVTKTFDVSASGCNPPLFKRWDTGRQPPKSILLSSDALPSKGGSLPDIAQQPDLDYILPPYPRIPKSRSRRHGT